jgi:uncharacterized protein
MLFDFSRLRGGVDHIERRYDPSRFSLDGEEFRVVAPVEFVADVRKDGRNVRLAGRLTTTLECDCSRCVEPFLVPVSAPIDLLLLPAPEEAGAKGAKEEEKEIAEDDLGVAYYTDEVIDLGDVMREQFYLAAPMKPLCREDCKGLCPVCGANRNRETCSCQTGWVDPRMEALRALKSDQ